MQGLFQVQRLYVQLEDWESLEKLLPNLRRHKLIDSDQETELQLKLYSGLIQQLSEQDDVAALKKVWSRIPKQLQTHSQLLHTYARQLLRHNAGEEAEFLLRPIVKKQWNEQLIAVYGACPSFDHEKQLHIAESWLDSQQHNPVLLLSLGRICRRNQLWGKARSYVNSSLSLQASTEAYAEMGQLLEQLGEEQQAIENYKLGLGLA